MSTIFSKRIICFISILTLLFGMLCIPAHADDYPDGHIIIDTVSAVTGDSVIVKINIENNPGIMAMTISITYDSNALTYEGFYRGYLRDYTVADHPDKNLIRFVNCETGNRRNNDTIVSLKFKVKDNAEFGFYPISIDYKSGDFCNYWLKKLMPEITSGGVDVAFNGNNCSHKKYSDWETAAKPSCMEPGAEQRTCEKCGHVDIRETPAAGHDYEDFWTVDTPATADSSGTMSRHCKNCDAYTDLLTFSLEQSEENNLSNNSGSVIEQSDFTDKLVKEQLPEKTEEKNTNNNQSEITSNSENTVEQIINSIIENDDGPIAKILAAIPNVRKLGTVIITAIIVLLRLILI